MMKLTVLAACLASAAAFAPAARPARRSAMKMAVEDMPGITKPLGLFDPLGFSKKGDAALVGYREAELKHGRMAMMAALGYFVQCVYHPLYKGASMSNNPFEAASQVPALGWVQIVAFASFMELMGILAKKRPEYMPGDLIGSSEWVDNSDEGWLDYQNKELNNGRLAMLAMAGLMAQQAMGAGYSDILFKDILFKWAL